MGTLAMQSGHSSSGWKVKEGFSWEVAFEGGQIRWLNLGTSVGVVNQGDVFKKTKRNRKNLPRSTSNRFHLSQPC